MPAGMGNLLETDSDVASISDGEKERTDGDGMESENLIDNSKSTFTHGNDSTQGTNEPAKTVDDGVPALAVGTNENVNHNVSSRTSLSAIHPSASAVSETSSLPNDETHVSSKNISSGSKFNTVLLGKSKTVSPRELPPRSQLIQLKPVMCKPRVNSRNSMESLSEGINKQKNPRFIPYEPYRGAVRPMVGQGETVKKHSRTSSEVSAASNSLENVIGNLSLNNSGLNETPGCSLTEKLNGNTHHKSLEGKQPSINTTKVVDAQCLKLEKVIEKQTHALILLKERLKIAEKDNDDLHKENTRLKKLLVDSLSGDIIHNRRESNDDHAGGISSATSESFDTLSNEIEVWRSKFLSSCVLVEQLTRENGTLNEAVGTAANILKDIKLSSSLAPAHFEQVNVWLRANRPTSSTVSPEDSNIDES